MKRSFIIFLLLLSVNSLSARHLKGGFFSYTYLGPGTANPANLRYKITLTEYMDCSAQGLQVDDSVNFTIFDAGTSQAVANPGVRIKSNTLLSKRSDEACITGDQAVCFYRVVVYELASFELPVSAAGYIVTHQRCCRIENMDNVQNSGAVGNTYSIQIPGTSSPVPDANKNSSPLFPVNDTVVICENSYFQYLVNATDPDGDKLSYGLCDAYLGGSSNVPAPNPASRPPYNSVPYLNPFLGDLPLGSGVSINSETGLLSGIAPPIFARGEYVVTICVNEYRNNVFVAQSRKELHVRVENCVPLQARLAPKPVTCDGFNVSFFNDVINPTGTLYEWDFGDTASGPLNTSPAARPSHTYTDTGVYTVKLKISLNGLCADSTTLQVKVYPGFFPDFEPAPPLCKGVPVIFNDKTTSRYGVPTGWRWDFGNTAATDDTSNQKNAPYTYNTAGTYTVRLIVGNTFGCIDTIQKNISIPDKPVLSVFPKDTSYCAADTIQLRAVGTGNFSWLPAVNILNANTATPLVYPSSPVKYYVTMTAGGCTNTDSVTINPVNDLTNSIAASSVSICEGDSITLTGSSNHTDVTWQWTPSAVMALPVEKITKAFPVTNTQVILKTRWGKNCVATATKDIAVKKLLIPEAGPDQAICIGQQTAQLNATGADGYQWIPSTGLNNPNIANPVASPVVTTTYKVYGSTTGCAVKKEDSLTILVRTLPPLGLTNDTLICSIDTLQLNATGTGSIVWSPNYSISNTTAAAPLVSPDVPTKYHVTLTDGFGCVSNDSVMVDVKLFVTINAGNDTTICRTDGFKLNTFSDALSYKWEPSTYLDNDKIKQPITTPLDPVITYKITGNIGKCQSSDFITITTVPYPIADAGNDTLVCYEQPVPLHATGGVTYTWSPAIFLNSTNTADPVVVKPTVDTRYTVIVTDNKGCPKPVTDSVLVSVYPKVVLKVNNDTSVVIGQPLQLVTTGGRGDDTYLWSPPQWLSSANVMNPIATPESDITYTLQLTTRIGNCIGSDTVKVKVFILPPSFYVPTAFSPNGDGLNEILKPIALGMKKINYFRIYNRAGKLIFSTTRMGEGWDGTYKGNPQDPANYVWMAQGETYKGEVITRKGNAVLVR